MTKLSKRLYRLLAFSLVFVLLFGSFSQLAFATDLEDQYEEVNKQLAEVIKQRKAAEELVRKYANEADSYQSQMDGLTARMTLLDNEIREKQLEIDQLEVSINILQEEIFTSESIIEQTKFDVEQLENEVNKSLNNMYVDYKTGVGEAVIDTSFDPDNEYKYQEYTTVIANKTVDLADQLDTKIESLRIEAEKLEQKKVSIIRDQQSLEEERASLDQKKADLEMERQSYYQLQSNVKDSKNLAQQSVNGLKSDQTELQKQQDELRRQIEIESGQIPVGGYVPAGTVIGFQGNSGHSYGSHLHLEVKVNGREYNPCSKLGSGPFSFCRGDGTLPEWPLQVGHAFTSSYGWRWGRFHHGIDLAGPHKSRIYATHSGYLKKWFSRGCWGMSPCNYGGTYIAEVCQYPDCTRGIKTTYLHLDPISL